MEYAEIVSFRGIYVKYKNICWKNLCTLVWLQILH